MSDRTSSEPSDLWRIYRGLSARSMKAILGEKVEPQSPASSDEEEDLLDVLAFTQPADPCRMTVQRKELRPHAQRILSSAEYCTGYSLTLTDLANLVRVLLSLQVDGSVRNIINKQASIVSINEDNDALNSLTSAVTAKFNVHGREEVKWQTFKEVINLYLVRRLLLLKIRHLFPKLTFYSKAQPAPSIATCIHDSCLYFTNPVTATCEHHPASRDPYYVSRPISLLLPTICSTPQRSSVSSRFRTLSDPVRLAKASHRLFRVNGRYLRHRYCPGPGSMQVANPALAHRNQSLSSEGGNRVCHGLHADHFWCLHAHTLEFATPQRV